LLLVGSIILLVLIIVGIVVGLKLFSKKKSSLPPPTLAQHVWVAPTALESPLLVSVKGSEGPSARSQAVMRVEGVAAAVVVSFG
jgi:hypothetical protein